MWVWGLLGGGRLALRGAQARKTSGQESYGGQESLKCRTQYRGRPTLASGKCQLSSLPHPLLTTTFLGASLHQDHTPNMLTGLVSDVPSSSACALAALTLCCQS